MHEVSSLRVRIEEMVGDGRLPCEDCIVAWYGAGRGRRCGACFQRILSRDMEIECEVPQGGTIRFHLTCYDVWQTILTGKDRLSR